MARGYLPQDRFQTMKGLITQILVRRQTTLRSCLILLGHMASCTHVMTFEGFICVVYSYGCGQLCAKQAQNGQAGLAPTQSFDLICLMEKHEHGMCWSSLCSLPFMKRLITDASLLHRRAHLDVCIAQDTWTLQESKLHINLLGSACSAQSLHMVPAIGPCMVKSCWTT